MSEFTFRNLSVKLFPESADDEACLDGTTQVDCGACTDTVTCGPCTDGVTEPVQSWCRMIGTNPIACGIDGPSGYQDEHTQIVVESASTMATFVNMRDALRSQLAQVESRLVELEAASKPSTVEQIDRVKAQMLAAVAELDEQRAALSGDAPAAG